VRFHYDRPDAPILDGVSLDVQPGELIAIVGASGSGKSTMLSLLQRFYDPISGAIRIDGKDVRRLKQRSLRKHIGVVLQDALLFNETVRDNIAYGRPSATMAEIEAAARAANAHGFIRKLPKGYDTIVGERGGRLSGGERQRLAIARALLKDPALLILDEATSALDAESEALVQAALERLVQGRTTFVVAHRLSTVVKADRIVVLRDGRIADLGTHRQLCERNGYYAHLVRSQLAGLVDREPPLAA
jgi:ATP-binding cassette subfamily B protein